MIDQIQLVIFDCDGVLVDSERLAVRVESAALARLGWPLTETEVAERFLGRSDAYMTAQVEAQIGGPLPPGWQRELDEAYAIAFDEELTAVDGIIEALDTITALGLATCVASSGTHEKMRRTLGKTDLRRYFEGRIYSGTEVPHGKPAPDLFLYAAAQMNVEPRHCVVVEDSQYGVQAARAAGMRSLGYAGGITPAEWLAGPDTTVFTDMRKLAGLIQGLL
ncbi:MAG TPA: HAD family phosphatase [Actinocrinis sp.]|nr:HAD family phosphatase [Actinocrinis sp.]